MVVVTCLSRRSYVNTHELAAFLNIPYFPESEQQTSPVLEQRATSFQIGKSVRLCWSLCLTEIVFIGIVAARLFIAGNKHIYRRRLNRLPWKMLRAMKCKRMGRVVQITAAVTKLSPRGGGIWKDTVVFCFVSPTLKWQKPY